MAGSHRRPASCRPAATAGQGAVLAQAMRGEIALMYDGLDFDGDAMQPAGPGELGPPYGAFIVGASEGKPVCCGGIKRLDEQSCEFKKMYVVPELRGRGVARRLLHALEDRARELGYGVVRLDTGPKQLSARGLFESNGYVEIPDFNGNDRGVLRREGAVTEPGRDRGAGKKSHFWNRSRATAYRIPISELSPTRNR